MHCIFDQCNNEDKLFLIKVKKFSTKKILTSYFRAIVHKFCSGNIVMDTNVVVMVEHYCQTI